MFRFQIAGACVLIATALLFQEPAEAQALSFAPADGAPVCRGSDGYAQDFGQRRTFLWRPAWLKAIAADPVRAGGVVKKAEAALLHVPYSVTDKKRILPGASANDYASIGPYWWPNTKSDNGLPYVRRDGDVNPERNGPEFDKNRLASMGDDLEALSVAYFITSDERFAKQGAKLLRAWFLDPDTRMNPNMNFAQGIPGKVNGRGEGIIEVSDLSTIVESIGLLGPSEALTDKDHAGLRKWYADFATWMTASENGKAARAKNNNHGVFFDFYLSHFSIFAGLEGVATQTVENFPTARLKTQMDSDGRFPAELNRTRSWHYSNYLVGGAARLATIAECTGHDLWNATWGDERSLGTAHTFLNQYSGDLASWPYPDRDHAAGAFEKMRNSFAQVDMMFAGAEATSQPIVLP